MRSPVALVHRDFFLAPAASEESDARRILGLTASYQAALAPVGQDPGLRRQIDMLRRDCSLEVPAGDRESSRSWVDIRSQRGAMHAVAWICAIVLTYGLALIVLAVLVVSRRQSNQQHKASDSPQEIRRVQVSQFWEREAHIEQLSPGTSSARTSRILMGVTQEQSRELTVNLCLPPIPSVGPELTRKLGSATSLEQSREVETTIQLSNDRTGYYRRIAIWHVVDYVRIEALAAGNSGLGWAPRTAMRYSGSEQVATSYVDIAKADL
ncbi:hypothetical protein ACLMAJ_30045 [Nocardia sp. KC 131]|uniref:hypothetical protein n=1 Tax=Nocardia arseniciresistens TaxID=3392119 RepID=UPI00398F356A